MNIPDYFKKRAETKNPSNAFDANTISTNICVAIAAKVLFVLAAVSIANVAKADIEHNLTSPSAIEQPGSPWETKEEIKEILNSNQEIFTMENGKLGEPLIDTLIQKDLTLEELIEICPHPEILAQHLEKNPDSKAIEELFEAARDGELNKYKEILTPEIFNIKNFLGNSILHSAGLNNLDQIEEILTLNPEVIKSSNYNGETLLHFAGLADNAGQIKELHTPELVSMQDKNGETPAHWGAENGYLEQFKETLVSNPEILNIENIDGRTPLDIFIDARGITSKELIDICPHPEILTQYLEKNPGNELIIESLEKLETLELETAKGKIQKAFGELEKDKQAPGLS